eukprot:COSAG01_NODE_875_length_12972_cov_61.925503_1_plen_74_part_00
MKWIPLGFSCLLKFSRLAKNDPDSFDSAAEDGAAELRLLIFSPGFQPNTPMAYYLWQQRWRRGADAAGTVATL